MGIREARRAVHDRDGRCALQDALVLTVAQFVHPRLLLREQPVAQDDRLGSGDASVERAASPQVRDVRGADQDLGRHAADVDAGAADRAAFDERQLNF